MPSRRVYITLNDTKEKDRVIIDYLSSSYSEPDAIKEAIYRLATNNTDKVQLVSNSSNKVKKGTKPKRSNKVQKGANNTQKVQKISVSNSTKKVKNVTDNTDKVKQNELDQLSEFI